MDGAILLIAADDGPMPQTREHLLLAKQVGVEKVIVFVNKADLVDHEMLELVELEAIELLQEYDFNTTNTPIIYGSAKLALEGDTSEYGEPSIIKLISALDNYIELPERDIESPFVMPIDNALPVKGRGTVIVGTIKQGVIKKKDAAQGMICLSSFYSRNKFIYLITDEITLNSNHAVTLIVLGLGMNKKTSISDMQVFKKSVNTASAGDNVGINIKSIPAEAIKKGMLLVKGDCFKPTNHFEGTTYFLSKVCILPIHLKLPKPEYCIISHSKSI